MNKNSTGKSSYRGLGSIDFQAAARSVLIVGRVKNEPETRVVCHVKSSLAPEGKSIAFRLDKDNGFELIGEDVMIPESDWNEPNRFETSNVDILAYEKSYRYIRFYASSAGPNEEYFARTDRGTVQIEEIYLGIEWE